MPISVNSKKLCRCVLFLSLSLFFFGLVSESLAQSMAEEYPPNVEELQPTSGWAPPFRKTIEKLESERVPLLVDWADNEAAESAVTFGVPFARGALESVENLRLIDENGRPVPAGFRTTATWEGPNGPLRWALGHAVLERDREYFLELGTEVSDVLHAEIQLEETEESIIVDTGPMKVVLSRISPSVVESVQLGGENLIRSDAGEKNLPVVVDGKGQTHTAGGHEEGLKAEVVEAGPGRAAVRREGWYTNSEGERFCQFVTYTYFYAGQAGIRHDHTLIVAFDTNEHTIHDIMLPIALELDADREAVFAADPSPDGQTVKKTAADASYSLVQKRHDAWELTSGGQKLQSGSRAGGWFGISDGQRGAFAGLSDFWQQYPAELEADGDVMRIHLWPSHGTEHLDFRPSSKWQLGDEYPGDHVFHNRWYRDGLDEMTQGYGVGKTHNIYVNFFTNHNDSAAKRLTRAQTVKPVIALPAPEYVCSTEAFFGRMHHYDPENYPEIEALIQYVVDTYSNQREQNEQYGWIHFGDVFNTGELWRRWGSMFYGFPNVMPRLFLRSGHRGTWDFHRVNTRHVTDIDICHLDSDEYGVHARRDFLRSGHQGKVKGMRYGGDGGIAHYAGDPYATGPDHHFEFMAMDYYINGNLRTWEVANYYLEAHAAERDKNRNMLEYRHRGTGGALRLFSEGYWATWKPEYLSIMHQVADRIYEGQGVDRSYEGDGTRRDDAYMNPAKILYYQITGEERMRDLFLHDMTLLSRERNLHGSTLGGRGATLSGLAHAYWFTGEDKFLPFLAWQLELVKERGVGGLRGNFLARHATHGYQLPQAMALLEDIEELPEPQGPAVPEPDAEPLALQSNWAYYLLQENDGDFSVAVDVNLHRGYATRFHNRHEWIERFEGGERQALRVIDPDGQEIRYFELPPDASNERVEFSIPADGKTGTYAIVPANMVNPALSLRLVECSLDRRVAHAGGNWTRPRRARTWYFTVPARTGQFRIKIKSAVLRAEVQYGVQTPEGDNVAQNRWESGTQPRNEWEEVELDAGEPEQDEVWSLTFLNAGETYLRFEGVPGYVASCPDELFMPDPAMRQALPAVKRPKVEEAAVYESIDFPWKGTAAFINRSVDLGSIDLSREMMNRERGTVEMWVKTSDPYSNISDKILLSCGSFRLFRRINIGTYARIGGQRYHSFFALPTNRWTHLAFTWQPSDQEAADLEIRLFADGVEVKYAHPRPQSREMPHKSVAEDWPGERLTVSAGAYVTGLRVSDTVRYGENFPRPESPFDPDEHTCVLWPLDESGSALIFGDMKSLQ